MSKEKKTKNIKEKGIYPFGNLWWLIILDFILFYFTFFNTFWTWIDENKGIPFTLLLFVLFILFYNWYKINKNSKENMQKEYLYSHQSKSKKY